MPLAPDLSEVLDDVITSRLADVHTAIPGTIKTYDAAKQTAEVIIQVRAATPSQDGDTVAEEHPVIPNVPVQWPRGGGYALHFPLAPGDHVLLVFSEAAIGHWRATGQVADPGDLRRHSLAYPIAIPGIAPESSPIGDAPAGMAVLNVGSGVFRVGGPSAEFVALANLVKARLDAIQAAFDAHTHPVPGVTPGPGAVVTAPTPGAIGPLAPVASSTLKAQ